MKQVREALGDDADHPVYVQTVPKRGYRFIAPVDTSDRDAPQPIPPRYPGTDLNLQKVLWSNIAELRLAEEARKERQRKTRTAILWAGIALRRSWRGRDRGTPVEADDAGGDTTSNPAISPHNHYLVVRRRSRRVSNSVILLVPSVTHQTIIVLDFGSQFTQLIARRLRELSVYSEVWPPDTPIEKLRARKSVGVILSGGPKSVSDATAPEMRSGESMRWAGRCSASATACS